jgi:hypothetical protein
MPAICRFCEIDFDKKAFEMKVRIDIALGGFERIEFAEID